jgi:hypothetical protein
MPKITDKSKNGKNANNGSDIELMNKEKKKFGLNIYFIFYLYIIYAM